ncbi:HAD family acid phosphatase [Aquella oligotrophica]|uniref:HAD family hydrolase n=1 Tax=Aquella oligotrophica TaxID=2067065 RepID=A0A2I7N316_9NEIS|nr:HAD family acid phosphatase [Aquella oligotrophica]AUR50857.1 HAD family hydrolase [Aquella oligotrophica]
MKKILTSLFILSSINCYADNICSPEAKQQDIKQAVKWYRDSAEKKALYNQTFLIGTNYVSEWVKSNHPKAKSWGVVLDIDETTLDNSWYFRECGELASNESDFSHYVANPMKSTALPGVAKFTQLVHDLGGYVSFVSNRDGSFKDETGSVLDTTTQNLKHEKIYFDQVVLANRRDSKTPSNKNPRFNAINTGNYDATQMVWSNKLPAHKVIAYFGDNIQDFPKFKQGSANSLDENSSEFSIFGKGYFILPNPMYGSWEANQYN